MGSVPYWRAKLALSSGREQLLNTVIATRVYLELTGYPQLGNSVLHIAHALWGGLLLIIAVGT